MKLCSFDGCDKKHGAKGLCYGHYQQQKAGKELRPLRIHHYKCLEDILSNTEKVGDCLLWNGYVTPEGYGRMNFKGKTTALTHRATYELATGEEMAGVVIHHKCGQSRCINPDHLQRASAAENSLEMLARRDYEAEIAALKARTADLEERVAYLEALLDNEQVA